MATWKQFFNNLPPEIQAHEAFIPVGANKHPIIEEWTDPETWKTAGEIEGRKGLVMSDIPEFFLDFDHLRKKPDRNVGLSEKGVDERARPLFRRVMEAIREALRGEQTYAENSCSATGAHMIIRPDPMEFPELSLIGGKAGTIRLLPEKEYLEEVEAKREPPKLEMYYHCAHQIILTGDRLNDAGIVSGEAANAVVYALLELLKESMEASGTRQEEGNIVPPVLTEAEVRRYISALSFIDPDCHYEDWIHIGNACRNAGLSYEVFEAWSRGDYWKEESKKYTPNGKYSCKAKWKTFTGRLRWNGGTIILQAKRAGWHSPREAVPDEQGPQAFDWDDTQKEATPPGAKPTEAKPTEKKPVSLLSGLRTDLGQATTFVSVYGRGIRFCTATGFLVYDGIRWNPSAERARGLVHRFVLQQAKEARKALKAAQAAEMDYTESLAGETIDALGPKSTKKKELADKADEAEALWKWILKQQGTSRISAVLSELPPKVLIDHKELDRDAYKLNTPEGTVDLRSGELLKHNPEDYITKCCSASPSEEGLEEWNCFLDQITGADKELQDYLQMVMGMAAIGEVKQEKALFFYGPGGNGKSAFTNAISAVLGDYAGRVSPDIMTNQNNKTGPAFAELRGLRFVIASELSEGARLNTRIVKLLATADDIVGEPKFHQQFKFKPSHTLVVNTNHLPKLESNDKGSTDRVVIVPFLQRFRGTGKEIMDYGHVLASRCGGAILQWVVIGAKRFIEVGYKLPTPEAVRKAVEEYQQENDWIGAFIEARCETDLAYSCPAGELYREYDAYCKATGEYKRSAGDFKRALVNAGYIWRPSSGNLKFYYGLRIAEAFTAAAYTPFQT